MLGTMTDESQSLWQERLQADFPQAHVAWRQGILNWLLGSKTPNQEKLTATEAAAFARSLECRYCILEQRYCRVGPTQGYHRLLTRLGSLLGRYPKIRSRLTANPAERQVVIQLIEDILNQFLTKDTDLQRQQKLINDYTEESNLRYALFFANLEEYCLQRSGSSSQPRLIEGLISLLR